MTTSHGIDRTNAAGGTGAVPNLAVGDGGTGAATLADGGLVVGNGTAAVEVVTPGATTDILVGGGAATNPVWTAATGTGAPVRATSPALVTPALGTPSQGVLTNCTGLPAAGVVGTAATGGGTATGTNTGDQIIATQAEQETATAIDRIVSPGRQQFHPSAAKAWIQCNNGTTVYASYNIASLTDLGSGRAQPNYTVAMSGTVYAVTCNCDNAGGGGLFDEAAALATGSFEIRTFNTVTQAAQDDAGPHSAIVMGDE